MISSEEEMDGVEIFDGRKFRLWVVGARRVGVTRLMTHKKMTQHDDQLQYEQYHSSSYALHFGLLADFCEK